MLTDFLLAGSKGLEPSASGVTEQGIGHISAVSLHFRMPRYTSKRLFVLHGSNRGPTKKARASRAANREAHQKSSDAKKKIAKNNPGRLLAGAPWA